jgi:hypothetical protein
VVAYETSTEAKKKVLLAIRIYAFEMSDFQLPSLIPFPCSKYRLAFSKPLNGAIESVEVQRLMSSVLKRPQDTEIGD